MHCVCDNILLTCRFLHLCLLESYLTANILPKIMFSLVTVGLTRLYMQCKCSPHIVLFPDQKMEVICCLCHHLGHKLLYCTAVVNVMCLDSFMGRNNKVRLGRKYKLSNVLFSPLTPLVKAPLYHEASTRDL